jgi:hypothetical protein
MVIADPTVRLEEARKLRDDAAQDEFKRGSEPHPTNGDEERYPNRIGNSTKGLRHDPQTGEVVPAAYEALLDAIADGSFDAFERLATDGHLGCTDVAHRRRLVNPESGYAFDLEGADSHQLAQPPAPAFASAQEAGEAVELYWMALMRDINFADYDTSPVAQAAIDDLSKLSDFRGPKVGARVTSQTLYRDTYPGCTDGPYVSQFLLQPVGFGAQRVDVRIQTNAPGVEYVTTLSDWLDVINGCQPAQRNTPAGLVFARNGRDLAAYVHSDVLFQAYFVAMLNLLGGTYRANPGNPYGSFIDHTGTGLPLPPGVTGAMAQIGFGTFGAPAIAELVCEPATRALKHQWYQKWLVHRRLRPEEFGGHVEVQRLNRAAYPFHGDLFRSTALDTTLGKFGTHLLPQAFPEGSPAHTAYGSGHATVAGACVTVLKAFFDETEEIRNPMVPSPDGQMLVPYTGAPLTVGGELNKLASNVSQARNIAGVHWRTDATEANRLGEEVSISLLRDMRGLQRESFDGYTFTRFDGTMITV